MSDDGLWFEGICFPTTDYDTELLKKLQHDFLVKNEDTILVTYPKSGTHWLKEILSLIHSNGDPKWVQGVPSWDRLPWVESVNGYKLLSDYKDPRMYTSHLPIQLFPKSFFSSKAKVIYCIRNPRDVLVSSYLFLREMTVFKMPDTFQEFMEMFLQGNVIYGSWFEHIRGWLSMRQRENVLVVSYEELKKDTRSTIEKICQFLGKELKPEEIDSVIKYSSFQFMKENKMSNFSLMPAFYITENFAMMRKGVTGDWKNLLTVAQAEAFDKVYQEKMKGYPPKLFPWETC